MNIKLNISPTLLLRIPAFSINDDLFEVWEELKQSISHSSSVFYEKIKDISAAELADLDEKTQYTIWKYFNRSKYRGTPFGSFAGFAVAKLGTGNDPLVFSSKQYLHHFKDWSQYKAPEVSRSELTVLDRLYYSNSSYYAVADHIRFISIADQVFELSEIDNNDLILELLVFCAIPVSYSELLRFAAEKVIGEEVLLGMLMAMLEAQLLFTDLNANIIGPEYFERTAQPGAESLEDYLVAEREVWSGELSNAPLVHLSSCINTLLDVNQIKVNESLSLFVSEFNKRYEEQEVSLMTALDPELGIGYGQLTSAARDVGLVQELPGHADKKKAFLIPWTDFSKRLLNAMLSGNRSNNEVLQLKNLIPEKLEEAVLKPANSFSVLARFAGDLVVLDSIGGCTANALSGRFTLANEPFAQHCRAIAAAESAANPAVIFFDLAYMAEGRVDNINRRKQMYAHEMPILNYSCSEELIALNDILLKVQGEQVLLYSQKYGKRLIPKLASAYNYSRSDLSVYRFLCDLQHQQIQSQLLFDVELLLPGLDYYPRIQYENLVLSLAKWRVKGVDLKGNDMLVILDKMGLSRYFSVGSGDQTLCFDKANPNDLVSLKHYVNQYDDFVLTEVIYSDCQLFMDDNKKCYFTQVLLAVTHQEEIYPGYISKDLSPDPGVEPVLMPGKDWLCYEIYCHSDRSNFVLSERISGFIAAHSGAFHTWFFIRYNDPSPHLRLRIQLKDQQTGYIYMTMLMELFASDLRDGLIKDVQMKTYYRELMRYGAAQMKLTEMHFSKDSAYAIELLRDDPDDFFIYANCIELMKGALGILQLETRGTLGFVRKVQRAFEQEHHLKTEDFKMVNREWSNFKAQLQEMEARSPLPLMELQQSFLDTLMATPLEQRPSLYCSLFHMHINRLFSDHQRAHELIIYSFLYKQLQMELQRGVLV